MNKPRWVSVESAVLIHDLEVAQSGGLPGVRDLGMLESAIDRPRNKHAYESTASLSDLAAAYAFGLARNHPFADANKRAALLISLVFHEKNGWELAAEPADIYGMFMGLAAGHIAEADIASWFESHTRPRSIPLALNDRR